MRPSRVALTIVLAWAFAHPALASGELSQYLSKPDSSYAWREVGSGEIGRGHYIELALTSQTWQGIAWKHQLFVFRPPSLDSSSRQAFLYIDGGRWRPEFEAGQPKLPREARLFMQLATDMRAPVAVVRQVPFQPIFDRREDALIAYTFDRYLQTGQTDWPLLLPMVKSAARAMDAVQEVLQQRWQIGVQRFTVSGASKRGWTSWLTAAVDPRVASVAPMVIDMLNIPAQIDLQRTTFGALSEEVRDYEDIDLPGRIDSDLGRKLLAMVDPYSYRAALKVPKLILLGTNDRYWPLDATNVYWKGLSEPKRLLRVPNQGHKLRDYDRLIAGLTALHRYSARNSDLPDVSWTFTDGGDQLRLAVQTDRKAQRVQAWSATSPTRDFRTARWTARHCERSSDGFLCTHTLDPNAYTALFSELTFKESGEHAFSLSTGICVVGKSDAPPDNC